MKRIDYVVGQIKDLDNSAEAGWNAYYRADYRNELLRLEIEKLKKEIRRLKSVIQKPG